MAHESVKGILFFSCTLLLFAVDALAQPADPHWKRYTIRREEFSVKLPEHPAMGHGAVKAIFSADGAVTNIKLSSGLPYGLSDNAIEAAKKIRFIPAMKDGKFVSTWMQLEFSFNLY